MFALNEKKESFLDCGMPGHGTVDCDVNINLCSCLSDHKIKAQPALENQIIQKYKKYQQCHQVIHHKSGYNKHPPRPSKHVKAKSGHINQVDTVAEVMDNNTDGDYNDDDDDDDDLDIIGEGVSCLHIDDDSELDDGVILAVETNIDD